VPDMGATGSTDDAFSALKADAQQPLATPGVCLSRRWAPV
jgi:hypothetical protein